MGLAIRYSPLIPITEGANRYSPGLASYNVGAEYGVVEFAMRYGFNMIGSTKNSSTKN